MKKTMEIKRVEACATCQSCNSCFYSDICGRYQGISDIPAYIEITEKVETEVSLALCEGRHAIPQAEDGAIFGNNLNPLDLAGMEATAEEKLMDVQVLNLYVTGLTVALVTVINVCHNKGIDLTLWHFDRESGEYYSQKVR